MTEPTDAGTSAGKQGGESQPAVPPKPPLSPSELKRERARQAKLNELEERRAAKAAEQLRRDEAEARGEAYHGHHVVDSEALDEVFEEQTPEKIRWRHRLTHRVILSILGVIVVVALFLAFLVLNGVVKFPQAAPSTSSSAPADPNCPADTFDYQDNIGISVSVFNATSRAGLAGGLATELKARGYQVGTIGDKEMKSSSPGVIVSGLMGQAAAFNLQRNLPGLEYRKDDRADATVDVYLLGGYQGPMAADKVDKTAGKIVCKSSTGTAKG